MTVLYVRLPVDLVKWLRNQAESEGVPMRVIVQLLVCLVGLAALSEAIQWLLARSTTYTDLVRLRSPERLALRTDGEPFSLRTGARAFQASVSAKR